MLLAVLRLAVGGGKLPKMTALQSIWPKATYSSLVDADLVFGLGDQAYLGYSN